MFSDWSSLQLVGCGAVVLIFGAAIIAMIRKGSKIGKKGGGTGQ